MNFDSVRVEQFAGIDDEVILARVAGGETSLFEVLMRRYDQRLYRVIRAVLRRDDEVEDVMQQTYMNAFVHLDQFEGRSRFSTWLIRIGVREALMRKRRDRIRPAHDQVVALERLPSLAQDPEQAAAASELRDLLERAIDELPTRYRLVYVLRELEGLSTAETAAALQLGIEAVKTRLHRARTMLETRLGMLGGAVRSAFPFLAPRCDAVVTAVLSKIRLCRMKSDRPGDFMNALVP
jgi:RNA polymerase sigma-70 factor, ECF subfamily